LIKIMLKHILTLVSLVFLGVIACNAQSANSETNKCFGKSIDGVQMAITLNTNVIIAGSMIGITAEIKNSSTNAISMGETGPASDFDVSLGNDSGNKYKLTDTHPLILHYSLRIKLNAGESRDWLIPVTVGKDVTNGVYSLKAKRKFTMNGEVFSLESNLLKIQIKS
jgi:hypothetical protein